MAQAEIFSDDGSSRIEKKVRSHVAKGALRQLSSHVWQMDGSEVTDRPNLYLVDGADSSVMIDGGASCVQAEEFLQAVRDQGLHQPSQALLTHWHWDHTFGCSAIPCPVYAHPIACGYLEALSALAWDDDSLDRRVAAGAENPFVAMTLKLEIPEVEHRRVRVPDGILQDCQTFDLGGVNVCARYLTCDHGDDAVAYHVVEDDMLLIGDVLYDDYYHGPNHYSERRLRALYDEISAIDAGTLCDSHVSHTFQKQQVLELIGGLIETGIRVLDGVRTRKLVMRDGVGE